MSRFNQLAKQHRLALRETQTEYAARFGFETPTAVSLWEAGKRRVPDNVLEALVFEQLPQFITCEYCNGSGMINVNKEIGMIKQAVPCNIAEHSVTNDGQVCECGYFVKKEGTL